MMKVVLSLNKNSIGVLCAAILSSAFLACSTTKPPLREVLPMSVQQEHAEKNLRLGSDTLSRFVAKGTIAFTTRVQSGEADVTITRRDDSLRVDVRGPFGITVGKLLATKKRFLYYNALEGQVYTGTLKSITKILPFELPAPGLLGDLVLASLPRNAQLVRISGDSIKGILLSFAIDSEIVWYHLDPHSGKVVDISIGPNNIEAHYSGYNIIGDVPSESTFRMHDAELKFHFDEVDLHPGMYSLTFTIPEGIPRIEIKEDPKKE